MSKRDTYSVCGGIERVDGTLRESVRDAILVEEAEKELITFAALFDAIEGRPHIRQATDAFVAKRTTGATAVFITVGTAITFLIEIEFIVAAERNNLTQNVTGDTVSAFFSDNQNIGSSKRDELESI